jgi:hypothetical protein
MFICITNKLSYFNNFLKLTIFIVFILNIFFSIYVTVVRAKNIKNLIKEGAYDIRNSPLDRLGSIITRMIACTKGLCESGGTIAGAVAGLYTIDNLMKDLGYDPIFLPFIKRTLTNSSEADVDPTVESDNKNKICIEELQKVHKSHKSAKEEEAIFKQFYEDKFISKED